jgi:PAS domain S-box-containing protein
MTDHALVRHAGFVAALNDVVDVIVASDDAPTILSAMTRIAGQALAADRVLVYDIRLAEQLAVGLAEWHRPGVSATIGTYPLALFGEVPRSLEVGGGFFLSDASAPSPQLGLQGQRLLHSEMGIATLLWFPFWFRDGGYKLLVFNHSSPRAWAEDERAFVTAASRKVSLALEKLQLFAQRHDALTALAKSEAQYRSLYDYTPTMFFTVTEAGRVSSVNRFAVEHLGHPREALVGSSVSDIFVEEDRASIAEQLQRCFASPGVVFRWKARKVRGDGSVITVKEIARLAPDAREVLVVCEDVTEQERTEQAMLQAQKLESIGVLAGTIAHDFNNLLATVVGNAQLALLRLAPSDPVREPVEHAALAAIRAGDLVKQLLAYSGNAPFTVSEVDVDAVVRELTALLKVTIGRKAEVQLSLGQPPPVSMDPTQLRQVVMNLVHNAADAMEGRAGAVRVSTSTVDDGQHPFLGPGRHVRLEVSDDGVGMNAATLERIFDPFFTTRVTGRGLGLAAVRSIAERHGGAVRVESTPDIGTTFSVYFPQAPLREKVATADAALRPSSDLPQGAEVLIVDDDPDVLQVLADVVTELGLVPVVARRVASAQAMLASHPNLRCALIDFAMPDGGGASVVTTLRLAAPQVPVVLMSGFADAAALAEIGALAGCLHKPFTPQDLRQALVVAFAST